MNLQTIRQRAKPFATAGLIVLTLVSGAVVARSSNGFEASAPAHLDNNFVQDTYIDESLDYKLFLHRQARLVAPHEGASR